MSEPHFHLPFSSTPTHTLLTRFVQFVFWRYPLAATPPSASLSRARPVELNDPLRTPPIVPAHTGNCGNWGSLIGNIEIYANANPIQPTRAAGKRASFFIENWLSEKLGSYMELWCTLNSTIRIKSFYTFTSATTLTCLYSNKLAWIISSELCTILHCSITRSFPII